MSRPVVQDPLSALRGALVRPSARPQDTFIQPQSQPSGNSSGAAGLGSALSSLMQGLDKYSAGVAIHEKEQQKVVTQEQLAAGAMAYEQSRKRLGQAVRDGEIPAGSSPAFRDGYARSQLRALGTQYDSYLQEAFAGDPSMAEDTDAWAAFEHATFLAFGQENFAGSPVTDAQILKEFMPSRAEASEKVRNQVIARNVKAIEAQRRGTLESEVASIIFSDGADTNAAGAGEALSSVLSDYYTDYPTKEQGKWLNGLTVDLLYQKSLATGDASILQVARNVSTGTGKLSDTALFRSAVKKLDDKMLSDDRADEKHKWAAYNQGRKYRTHSLMSQLSQASTPEEKQSVIAALRGHDLRLANTVEAADYAQQKRKNNPVVNQRDKIAFNLGIVRILSSNVPPGDKAEQVAAYMEQYPGLLNESTSKTVDSAMSAIGSDIVAERKAEEKGEAASYQLRPLRSVVTLLHQAAGGNSEGMFPQLSGKNYRALASGFAVDQLTSEYYDYLGIARSTGEVLSERELHIWLRDQASSFYKILDNDEAAERYYRQRSGVPAAN